MIAEPVMYGGLDCVVVRSETQTPRLAMVLCHGFGASGEDLLGLAEPLLELVGEQAEEIAVIFPAAVLALDDRGLPGGRAWWWIDLDRLLNQPTPEVQRAFRTVRPAGMAEATQMLCKLVGEVRQRWNLSADQIVLGGFSQGSMIATDAAMTLPEPPAGLVIYSGALICEAEWKERAARLVNTKIVQSHGRRDPILDLSQGQALRDVLLAAGCQPKYLEFNGFHEIHPVAIHATVDLLKSLLV
ncbi:alpha/beta hydrolase [Anatilimnocola floriformis]|uniref:alpha/beta hydrolase n=1 Tax=Anatilimnocola floriformis TaxID=2948575 RepID=UPI0020C4D8A9|nr:alpha/beta fold hydrolase [Anatilimnocola floriformis]